MEPIKTKVKVVSFKDSKEEEGYIVKEIKIRLFTPPCPYCGSTNWEIEESYQEDNCWELVDICKCKKCKKNFSIRLNSNWAKEN